MNAENQLAEGDALLAEPVPSQRLGVIGTTLSVELWVTQQVSIHFVDFCGTWKDGVAVSCVALPSRDTSVLLNLEVTLQDPVLWGYRRWTVMSNTVHGRSTSDHV